METVDREGSERKVRTENTAKKTVTVASLTPDDSDARGRTMTAGQRYYLGCAAKIAKGDTRG